VGRDASNSTDIFSEMVRVESSAGSEGFDEVIVVFVFSTYVESHGARPREALFDAVGDGTTAELEFGR